MNANSDPIHAQYADMDFSDAAPVAKIAPLVALQAKHTDNKARITMRVDRHVLAQFKAKAAATGGNYQTMMNEALNQFLTAKSLEDVVRATIQQELKRA